MFGVVGVYVTLGGFKGVILADVFQTILIAVGAVVLTVMVFQQDVGVNVLATKDPGWSSLAPVWNLWPSYLHDTPASYQHYFPFGTMLLAGFGWLIFRVLAGPNVWDFQFFLTTKSARDASLAAGTWTVGYTLRWIIACAFLMLGIYYLDTQAGFDAEKIMPMVLKRLPVGLQGIFMAVLLAALMSTLSAMINVTSSVVTNDFLAPILGKEPHAKTTRAPRSACFGRCNHHRICVQFIFHEHRVRMGNDDFCGGNDDPGSGDLQVALVAVRRKSVRLEHDCLRTADCRSETLPG